jgi:hypothetical protein
MTTPATIQEAVRRIAEGFSPRAIILFGSQTRGAARPVAREGRVLYQRVA